MKILGQLQWLSRIYHRKLARRIGLALLIAYSALSIAITVLTMVIPARFARFLDAHFPGKLAARAQFVNSHSGMLLFFYSTTALCGLAFLVWTMWRDDVREHASTTLIDRFTGLAIALFVTGSGLLLTGYLLFDRKIIPTLYLVIGGPRLLAYVRVYTVVAFVAAGACLYAFKRFSKVSYGCTEVLVALAVNWAVIRNILPEENHSAFSLAQAIALVGTLYFFSRGFGNIVEGLEERSNSTESSDGTIAEKPDATEEEGV